MGWMSARALKELFDSGIPLRKEKETVDYEEIHVVEKQDRKLIFEAKKRYLRFWTDPCDVDVPLGVKDLKGLIKALRKHVDMKGRQKPPPAQKVGKDVLGNKIYGEIRDAFGVKITVKGFGVGGIIIDVEHKAVPHLREAEEIALVWALVAATKSP